MSTEVKRTMIPSVNFVIDVHHPMLSLRRQCELLVRAVERFYPPPLAVSVFVSP